VRSVAADREAADLIDAKRSTRKLCTESLIVYVARRRGRATARGDLLSRE
jgi:hypothetical protein